LYKQADFGRVYRRGMSVSITLSKSKVVLVVIWTISEHEHVLSLSLKISETAVFRRPHRSNGEERFWSTRRFKHPRVSRKVEFQVPLMLTHTLRFSDAFIYEYIGEVVTESSFMKRMRAYAAEGIRHFYFMMLQKDEVFHRILSMAFLMTIIFSVS
jgi:hypothetical protein